MTNSVQRGMSKLGVFLMMVAGLTHADTVTVTVTRSLPYHQEITPLIGDVGAGAK